MLDVLATTLVKPTIGSKFAKFGAGPERTRLHTFPAREQSRRVMHGLATPHTAVVQIVDSAASRETSTERVTMHWTS